MLICFLAWKIKEDTAMRDWMDLNGDGEIDGTEMMFAEEMLCTSREEHEALFGDAGDFEDDTKEDFRLMLWQQDLM